MLKSFESSLSVTEYRAIMTNNKDLVFLTRTGFNKVLGLFHCLEISGRIVVNPEEECAFILGLNQKNIIVVTPNIESLLKPLTRLLTRLLPGTRSRNVHQLKVLKISKIATLRLPLQEISSPFHLSSFTLSQYQLS